MGFFSRLFIPRGVRRAAHPGRAVKRAVTPKAVKQARRDPHPIDNAKYFGAALGGYNHPLAVDVYEVDDIGRVHPRS